MTKYLRCFKSGQDIIIGKRYEVIGEDDGDFVFIDDAGDEHSWPIEPDEDGDSYRDHFTLETDKDDASVTVLPDESLGGIEREYREVNRKAAAGERIKIVNPIASFGDYKEGDVLVVYNTDCVGVRTVETAGGWGEDGHIYVFDEEYAVLEPLNTAPLLSEQSAQDQAAATISALALRLDALTERVDALEAQVTQVTQPTTTVDKEVVLEAVRRFSEGLKRSVSDALKTPQQRRDEIVERVKADVKRLESKHQSMQEFEGAASFWPVGCEKYGKTPCHFVEYVVNHDKRTVVALIRFLRSQCVDYRGVAKCAPNDVFNAHIGKAIALYRALGLDVPAEYLNVPKPTEVRVGDVVDEEDRMRRTGKTVAALRPEGHMCSNLGLTFVGGGWAFIDDCRIVDDTREEVAA